MRPAMKFWSLMPAAETTTLWASTWAPLVNSTPAGLTSTIWPFAVILPAICEGSAPVTRFSVIALGDGCWNWTCCLLPTSKLLQLTAARCDVWSICVSVEVWPIVAVPATTLPPWGCALIAGCAAARCAAATKTVLHSSV